MKNLAKILSIAAVALTLGACNKDNINYNGPVDSSKENIGYLALGGMEASIMVDTENIDNRRSYIQNRASSEVFALCKVLAHYK